MGLSLLGVVIVWSVFPLIVLSDVYVSTSGKVVAMSGQVNMWLALAASVLGCYTASSLVYRKFSLHDIVFSAISVHLTSSREALPTALAAISTTIPVRH